MGEPSIGLVMAAYNARRYLESSIASIAEQDYKEFVCCIVDDGSTDGTANAARAMIGNDPRFLVVEMAHGGLPRARNFGVAHLPHTKYLSFPDSDDLYYPHAYAVLAEAAEAFGGAGAHAIADEIDMEGNPLRPGVFAEKGRGRSIIRHNRYHRLDLASPSTFDSMVQWCTVYPPGLALSRRDYFDEVGGFDESLWQFEDWDFLIRVSRLSGYAFVNDVVVKYRRHAGQMTSNHALGMAMDEFVRAKTANSSLNSHSQRQVARRAWRGAELRFSVDMARLAVEEIKKGKLVSACGALLQVGSHLTRFVTGPLHVRMPHEPVGRFTINQSAPDAIA
jgi:glycosyltransferase involved in cell wall biosynthesis